VDASSGEVVKVADDFVRPNGLAFSPDESRLYVTDTRRNHIRAFDVSGGRLLGGDVLATCSAGVFDGIRLDTDERIWAATGDGLHCFDPAGTLIGKLRLPEPCSNLVFGGLRRNWLFVTASTSVYAIRLNINGAARPAGRTRRNETSRCRIPGRCSGRSGNRAARPLPGPATATTRLSGSNTSRCAR
jgi:gluconolactonase